MSRQSPQILVRREPQLGRVVRVSSGFLGQARCYPDAAEAARFIDGAELTVRPARVDVT